MAVIIYKRCAYHMGVVERERERDRGRELASMYIDIVSKRWHNKVEVLGYTVRLPMKTYFKLCIPKSALTMQAIYVVSPYKPPNQDHTSSLVLRRLFQIRPVFATPPSVTCY